jgi:ribosomal protein L18E
MLKPEAVRRSSRPDAESGVRIQTTMPQHDFDLRALYEALDERRRERNMSWIAVAEEVNRHRTKRRPIAVSTITGLRQKPAGEGDGILQMLL